MQLRVYPLFRRRFGGPSTASADAGNEELARAEADLLAEAAEAESLA